MSARLIAAGHQATVHDYGSVQTFEKLHTARHPAARTRMVELKQKTVWDSRDLKRSKLYSRTLISRQERIWEEIGEKIAARRDFDFIVILVNAPKDIDPARLAAKRIRALIPSAMIVTTGPVFDAAGDTTAKALRWADCVLLGHASSSLPDFARHYAAREKWATVPNLAYADGVRLAITPPNAASACEADRVPPSYDPSVYPDIDATSKILAFTIAASPVTRERKADSPQAMASGLAKQVATVQQQHHCHAFHFTDASRVCNSNYALARELLARNRRISYSMDSSIAVTNPAAIGTVSASGCQAIGFEINSGSQRLLDTYYHQPFTVTEVERTLRACRISKLFTTTSYIYPSPEDDHHTRAETLRLIERSAPDSVIVSAPVEHDRSALFHEFSPLRRLNRKKLASARQELEAEILELDLNIGISPLSALLAELAGHQGREAEFIRQLTNQLITGDVFGALSTVERINQAAASPTNTLHFKPFSAPISAVGN